MSEIYKNRYAKKASFIRLSELYLIWVAINAIFYYYLLANLFVSWDSISLILKEKDNSVSVL